MMEIARAQELKKDLEVQIMIKIRAYEEQTGLRITKAAMEYFTDTRFFITSVWMPPKTRKDEG